ncbi:MAG TPA: peptidoglycan DD-metalloendopeptidase family protein, partial [Candidatus Absconditabacterales bacterium]|nr:peptidoglycan DD-metalloendopeptidase family protein [Candidatus Absconditabacterales bacterium]
YSFASEQEIPASEITPVATTTTEITTEEIPEINLEQFNSQIDQIQQTITLISERVSELVPYGGTTKAHERFVMLQNEVEKVTDSMQASYKKLEKIAIRMNITTQELKKTAEEIFSLKNSIKETQQTIVLMTEILFKLNNELTDKNYQIDDIKLFLKSDNISEPLSHDFLLQSLVAKMDELLGKLEQDKTNNLNLGKNLISMRATIKQDMTDSATTIQMLKQKQNYILEFLSLYKDNKIPAGIGITDLFESRKDVQLKIAETMKLIAEGASPLTFDFASRLSELNQTVERPFGDHFFSWPLQPVNNILSFFQDPSYQEKFGITNMGVDLSSSQLNPIYAPADGVVYRVVDKDGISLNWLVIAHKYGYSSAFAYMNSILVKEGELVSRGQLLGYSGGEPGTRGAGFSSQGSLLHFELAKDGIAIDPLLNLDLSLIPDQKLLPDTYQVKYLRNVADRAERRQGITFIEGANVFERRSNYLAKFGTPPYNTATFREKASEGSNIDIDLGLCIGMAESSLGKFLSTANNIGNVGN